jgi:hypothetical protein
MAEDRLRRSPCEDHAMPTPALTNSPCCVLLRPDKTAETTTLGGELCLCVFTGTDTLREFYIARHGGDFATREIPTRMFSGPDELRAFLKANEPGLTRQGVLHLAVDPAFGRDVDRVLIRTFIEAGTRVE